MKRFFNAMLVVMMLLVLGAGTTMASTRVYGIKLYDSLVGNQCKLVSFDVTSPDKVTEEFDLSNIAVRAAAQRNGKMYMLEAPELTCDALKTLDMTTGEINTVKEYELYIDKAVSLIVVDMTYDATTDKFYFLALDLLENESADADFTLGLYSLDPETGDAEFIGGQKTISLITLSADSDGNLFGIDELGRLWDINKANGHLGDIYEEMDGSFGAGLQSSCFDSNGNLYWAAFQGEDDTMLARFHFTEDYLEVQNLGVIANNAELIGLYVDDRAASANAPAAAENVVVTPAAEGILKATISWTNPTTDIDVATLTSNIDVRVMRDGEVITTLENCEPGSAASYTDENVGEGLHTYSVQAVNEFGEGRVAVAQQVFVGVDVPGMVVNQKAERTQTGYDIVITWDAPATGMNNGWFDTTTLKYNITRQTDGTVVAENISGNSFTDQTITATAGYSYVITAANGKGAGDSAETNIVVSGKALEVPYSSNFEDDEDFRLWTIIDGDNDGETWYRETNYAGTSDWFMKYLSNTLLSPNASTDDWFISAPIHLEAGKYYNLGYAIRLLSATGLFPCNYTIALGKGNTIEAQTQILSSIDGEENMVEFVHHDVAVKVDESGDYNIGFQLRNRVPTQITNIELTEVSAADLALSQFDGKFVPCAGVEHEYTVVVSNHGGMEVQNYTVTVCDEEDNILATTEVSEPLQPSTSATVTLAWTPAMAGKMNIVCNVTTAEDTDLSNNRSNVLTVNVMPKGEWANIGGGTNVTNDMPFNTYANYSASTCTYYRDEMITTDDATIKAAVFYFTTLSTAKEVMMPIRVYGNKELLFEGEVKLIPTRKYVEVAFDTPYTVGDGDLELTVCGDMGSIPQGYMFYITKDVDHAERSNYYNGNSKYDFTQNTKYTNTYSNVTFLYVTPVEDNIENVSAAEGRQGIYDLQGRRVSNPGKGLYIVNGRKTIIK